MNYRNLGSTGLMLSEIGIGCEGLISKNEQQVKEFFDLMEKEGINVIDLYSPNPDMRKNIAKAIKNRRSKFILQSHISSIWQDGQYLRTRDIKKVKSGFETMLSELDTDYIDIGMIHYVDSLDDYNNIKNGEIASFVKQLKQQGKIKYIAMSSHNPIVALKAVNDGFIEALMFSINPCYDMQPADENVEELWNPKKYEKNLLNMDKQRQELYETCEKKGVGITVMKAFGGGDLLNSEYSPSHVALSVVQCLHYALTRPAVASVMVGAKSLDELMQAIYYEKATDEEKDYATTLKSFPKLSWEGHCMYCGHCAPCPKGIDVALVTKFLNLSKAQGKIPETVLNHYNLLKHKASECIQCGACETRCPFKVKIRENMKMAKEIFELS